MLSFEWTGKSGDDPLRDATTHGLRVNGKPVVVYLSNEAREDGVADFRAKAEQKIQGHYQATGEIPDTVFVTSTDR